MIRDGSQVTRLFERIPAPLIAVHGERVTFEIGLDHIAHE